MDMRRQILTKTFAGPMGKSAESVRVGAPVQYPE